MVGVSSFLWAYSSGSPCCPWLARNQQTPQSLHPCHPCGCSTAPWRQQIRGYVDPQLLLQVAESGFLMFLSLSVDEISGTGHGRVPVGLFGGGLWLKLMRIAEGAVAEGRRGLLEMIGAWKARRKRERVSAATLQRSIDCPSLPVHRADGFQSWPASPLWGS